MNEIELKAQDADGNACESLFTARNITDKENPYLYKDYYNWDATGKLITDANGNPVTNSAISSKGDSYYWLTAATFQVNQNMDADVGKFGTTADIYQGQDAQDITEELLKVKSDKDKMQFRGCTSEEFLQTILSDIALNTASASTFETNYTYISNSIINQRLSVSGVDNDEEALNLVKFQEAYNLAAKMIQVMTEIYDRLILSTGV